MTRKPTIGQIVYYRPYAPEAPRVAAIVVGVREDGRIDLTTFGYPSTVDGAWGVSEGDGPQEWRWPPQVVEEGQGE